MIFNQFLLTRMFWKFQHFYFTFQDIYAIPSRGVANSNVNQRLIYFLSIVDVLTHYGVKKAAAKVILFKRQRDCYISDLSSQAAKTVKYGSSVDGISTAEPEQYAKR